jgi:predicted membrane channel-forming protein YqfA (hemolysin III family)
MQPGAWRDYRSIWAATVSGRDSKSSQWLNWLALLLVVVGCIARAIDLMPAAVFPKFELAVAAGWLTMVWMVLFIPASVLMNSAANARLVPRQRRRLMQMAAGSWMLIVAGVSFACGGWEYFPLIATYLLGAALVRTGMR